MIWPFRSKTIAPPIEPLHNQLVLAIKSITLPEATPRWWLFAKRFQDWQVRNAIEEGYNASAVVYACVEKRAKLIASVPWKAERRRGDDWEHDPRSPLQQLMNRPNPDQSGYELMYEASQALDLGGNAYISEIKGGIEGAPFQLWLLPGEFMRIKPGAARLVDYFEYDEAGTRAVIDSDDMVQLKMPNPSNRWFGMPVLMAAGRATDVDRESGIWQKSSLQNRGVLDLHFEVPGGTTPEQIDDMKARWKAKQSGPANAREPTFTSGKATQLGQTAVEMDFVDSRRRVWEEICAVFGMSLANLGMTEAVNLANAQAMDKALWHNTIIPQLTLIREQLNNQLAVEFGPDWRLTYDLSNVTALQENLSDKLQNAEKLQRLGYTRNEINERLELGFTDDPSGDVRYEPVGMMPTLPAEPEPDPLTDEEKRALHRLTYG